ncbi:mediator complex subunit NUT2 [Sporobolomyces koalae]|uniref:mediator complex subunit NUT2 n=1 Tax=Sporobolomyces koalae TaxID=500713 RepID=UPI003172F061
MTAEAPPPPATARPRLAIEHSLEHLLQSLLELGICASDVQETALESHPDGVAAGHPGGLIGRKAAQTVDSLARLHAIKDTVHDVMIPLEVISSVDQGRNPHLFTKDFVERLSGENMYTNGILSAVTDYRDLLTEQMKDAFPDLATALGPTRAALDETTNGTHPVENGASNGQPHDERDPAVINGNGNAHATHDVEMAQS